MKNIFSILLLTFSITLLTGCTSCFNDEPPAEIQFTFTNDAYSTCNANIFPVYSAIEHTLQSLGVNPVTVKKQTNNKEGKFEFTYQNYDYIIKIKYEYPEQTFLEVTASENMLFKSPQRAENLITLIKGSIK
ncbi:MAG: DUF3568 family protein [Lentisphaeria bacterium]